MEVAEKSEVTRALIFTKFAPPITSLPGQTKFPLSIWAREQHIAALWPILGKGGKHVPRRTVKSRILGTQERKPKRLLVCRSYVNISVCFLTLCYSNPRI